MTEFTGERNACLNCPAFYKCSKGNISSTAGGWEKKKVDGKEVICCIPREAAGAFKAMKQYAFYCLATPRGRLIANQADYTGNVPKWCPRLEGSRK